MADETDKKIAETINTYIRQARQMGIKEGVPLISQAFSLIQDDRQKQCLNDEIYSSAEHYLFARYLSAYIPSSLVKAGSISYDYIKLVYPFLIPQFSKCKPSELTLRQIKWKILGCEDGSVDMLMKTRRITEVSAENTGFKAIAGLIHPGL